MRLPILLFCLSVSAVGLTLAVPAQAATAKQMAQQEKMKSCNTEAGSEHLKGDARKDFMSKCLSAKPAAMTSQQEKMKSCNTYAATQHLSGNARKAFMSTCLKKS